MTPELNQVRHIVDITDMTNIKIGEMRKIKKGLGKVWDVKLLGNFDRRLLIMIPIFINNEPRINEI